MPIARRRCHHAEDVHSLAVLADCSLGRHEIFYEKFVGPRN